MPASEYLCTVKTFKMLTSTVFETTFETDKPLQFNAGQFVSVVIPGAGPKGRDLRRAYSIASAPEVRPIELCIKLVEDGPGTNFLYKLKPGDTFKVFAPYGDFVYRPKANRHAFFIATGTGVAPFHSMVTSQLFKSSPPIEACCLLGVRNESELLYQSVLSNIPKLKFIPTISQPSAEWKGFKGRVTDYLRGLENSLNWLETEFYLCGNGHMISEVKALLAEKGVAKTSIHQEVYYK